MSGGGEGLWSEGGRLHRPPWTACSRTAGPGGRGPHHTHCSLGSAACPEGRTTAGETPDVGVPPRVALSPGAAARSHSCGPSREGKDLDGRTPLRPSSPPPASKVHSAPSADPAPWPQDSLALPARPGPTHPREPRAKSQAQARAPAAAAAKLPAWLLAEPGMNGMLPGLGGNSGGGGGGGRGGAGAVGTQAPQQSRAQAPLPV